MNLKNKAELVNELLGIEMIWGMEQALRGALQIRHISPNRAEPATDPAGAEVWPKVNGAPASGPESMNRLLA